MPDVEKNLRETAAELLSEGKVDVVVGYEAGSLPARTRACFARNPEEAGRLVWNSFCTNNLAVYLPRLFERPANPRQEYAPPRVALVVKACDARSAVGLFRENQVPRENVTLIAVPCPGMVEADKVEAALEGAGLAGCDEAADGSLEATSAAGDKKKLKREEVLADSCLECSQPVVEAADVVLEGESRSPAGERYRKVAEFEAKSPAERWQYFTEEMARCIRCYACRQACPNCYCKVCFIDQTKPDWAGRSDDLSDTIVYHIGRMFHNAGRCVECDACVRACPVGIDLRLFTQKLGKDAKELFGHVPGFSPEEPAPLCTFKPEDSEGFITEP
jgi:ferredoxin